MNSFTASPHELRELTDGETLDLIYEIARDNNLTSDEAMEIIKRVLEDSINKEAI